MAVRIGSGRPAEKFWSWVVEKFQPANLRAEEVFPKLHGMGDPDNPGATLCIKDNLLHRKGKKPMKESSFLSTYRLKTAKKPRKRSSK